MSTAPSPLLKRRRRAPDEAKAEALVAARGLLLAGGPNAVTLSAVAGDIGVTHANLIHHFGSASGLQSALMGSMVQDLAQALDIAINRLRTDEGAPMDVVKAVFDAFGEGGAGRLAAWISLSGDTDHLEPVRTAVLGLVEAIASKLETADDAARDRISSCVLFIALSAFGDALIGAPLRQMLGLSEDASRRIVAGILPQFLVEPIDWKT